MKKLNISAILFAVILGLWLQSCGSSASGPSSITLGRPTVGSTYTYQTTVTDSTGKVISRDTVVQTILETGITYLGKTDVTKFGGGIFDYIAYESNGDISTPMNFSSLPSFWVKLPINGGTGGAYTFSDTTILGKHTKQEITTSFAGSENVSTAGKSFDTRKSNFDLKITTNDVSKSQTVMTVYVSTELGIPILVDRPVFIDDGGNKTDHVVTIMYDYTIK